jgi:hypothetical protein
VTTRALDAFEVWAIYERPRDYPAGYVVRCWDVGPGGSGGPRPVGFYADDLATARARIPAGLVRLARLPGDDPAILETWL